MTFEPSNLVTWIVSGAAVLTAVSIIYRKAVLPVVSAARQMGKVVGSLEALTVAQAKVVKSLGLLEAEIFTESGASLRREVQLITLLQHAVTDNMAAAMFISDAKGHMTYVNVAATRLFGLGQSEMLVSGWMACIPEAQRLRVQTAWSNSVVNNIPYGPIDFEVHPANSDRRWKLTTVARSYMLFGEVQFWVGRMDVLLDTLA